MPNERKAYEGHYVTSAGGLTYRQDRFRCTNVDGDTGAWTHTDWLVFNFCPFCGQKLENRQYTPEPELPA